MPTIVLSPGDVLKVQFDESDGAFEVHFDTTEHPNSVVIKETGGFEGSICGAAEAILYHEDFSFDGFDEECVPVEGTLEVTTEVTAETRASWETDTVESLGTEIDKHGTGYASAAKMLQEDINTSSSWMKWEHVKWLPVTLRLRADALIERLKKAR